MVYEVFGRLISRLQTLSVVRIPHQYFDFAMVVKFQEKSKEKTSNYHGTRRPVNKKLNTWLRGSDRLCILESMMIGWSRVGGIIEGWGSSHGVMSQVIGHNWRGYDRLDHCRRGGELTLGLVLGNVVDDCLGLTRNGPGRVVDLPCRRGIARIAYKFFDFLDQIAETFTQLFDDFIIGRIV